MPAPQNIECPPLRNQLTVEAWIESAQGSSEGLQSLVSKWSPREEWGEENFAAFDAGRIDGLLTEGYFGAVFDGRYIYFSPEHCKKDFDTHAVVLRYDTHAPFGEESSYAAYDARDIGGIDARGFYGAGFDGRYVYFIPRQIGMEYYHSRLLRLDTQGEFKDENSWHAFDIGQAQSSQSGAFDGRYLYLCPGFAGDPNKEDIERGNVIRYDTRAPFDDKSSYETFDLVPRFGARAACFDGGAFDGRYIYFVPLQNGVVARYDTTKDFHDAANWQVFDARPLGMKMCVGMVFDGQWMYVVPYDSGNVIRFDTTRDFEDAGSWQAYDAGGTSGLRCGGYDGGHFDGRFVYFVPFVFSEDGRYAMHGDYLRYDATKEFSDASSWQAIDASRASGLDSIGYNAGAFDGRYFYCAPWRDNVSKLPETSGIHGRILRLDTLGAGGSFSLRFCDYGHNGGLNAATPGPSFLVNTVEGRVLSVAAHRVLPPGRHHIAGVYDGKSIKLLINGEVVAEHEASGQIQDCNAPVALGRIENGLGNFAGKIEDAKIWAEARY